MDRRLTLPAFGQAPKEYEQRYLDDIVRQLNQLMVILRSPGEGRNTNIVLTALQNTDYGAEPGTIFEINGVLYVSVLYRAFPIGVKVTGSVGVATVNIL